MFLTLITPKINRSAAIPLSHQTYFS